MIQACYPMPQTEARRELRLIAVIALRKAGTLPDRGNNQFSL